MARPCVALVCASGILLLVPHAAAGGGWWTYVDVNRSTVAPGQRVEVAEQVFFRSAAEAEEASDAGRFHVYLLRGFDYSVVERAMGKPSPRNWWSLGGAEAIRVGPVSVSESDSNLARARAAFTVPELPPASYALMLCDAACAEPLADVIPAKGFTVVADPATAELAQRVEDLERRIRSQTGELADAHTAANRAQDVAALNARSLEQLETEVASLADEGGSSLLVPAGWLVAGALAGALALLVVRRRLQSTRPARVGEWEPSDEELRELLSSESGNPR
jgi:hypothetical protein